MSFEETGCLPGKSWRATMRWLFMGISLVMKLYWRWHVTIIALLFVAIFLRLSFWQWERHLEKKTYIATLEQRLQLPPAPFAKIISDTSIMWEELPYHRVTVSGTFDYNHEVILRNRRYEDRPGVFVLTPLKIDGTDATVLVSRGFAPIQYSEPQDRAGFKRPSHSSFTGLIKASVPRRFLAPADPPTGEGHPRVDAFLRVDLVKIGAQMPYPILPVWIEVMHEGDTIDPKSEIIRTKDERDDIMNPAQVLDKGVLGRTDLPPESFPVPVFDTIVPAGRHLGYVFEWALMAVATILIAIVLQLRPQRNTRTYSASAH